MLLVVLFISFFSVHHALLHRVPKKPYSFSLNIWKKPPIPEPVPTPTILDIGKVLSSEKLIEIAAEKHILPQFLINFYEKIPMTVKSVMSALYATDLLFFFLFQLTYKRVLRFAHKAQILLWKFLSLGTPLPFEDSILGFIEERNKVLARLMGFNYIAELSTELLFFLGFRIRHDFPTLISRVSYALFITSFVDLFSKKFLNIYVPELNDNKRQKYVLNKATSFLIWLVGNTIHCMLVIKLFNTSL